jgi:hypothetical protein
MRIRQVRRSPEFVPLALTNLGLAENFVCTARNLRFICGGGYSESLFALSSEYDWPAGASLAARGVSLT